MNIGEAFPSNYIKSSDLQGRTVRVQIDRVQYEEIGRDKERKPILYFIGKTKGMVLNRTNATVISQAYGSETEGWNGCEIELYVALVEMAGKQTEGLRVRIPARKPAARPQREDFQAPLTPAATERPAAAQTPPPTDDIPW